MRLAIRSAFFIAWIRTGEQPLRVLSLTATLAIAVMAWMVLSAIAAPFLASKVGASVNANLGIANARVQTSGFPLRHVHRLEQMSDVAAVSYFSMASFPCGSGAGTLTVNAYGGPGTSAFLRSGGALLHQLESWEESRNGILVGADAAERCGLRPGMELSPVEFLSNTRIPIRIVGVLPPGRSGMGDRLAYGHYAYFNALLPEPQRDQVLRAVVWGVDASRLAPLGEEIEQVFTSADPPLQANVSSGAESALARFGQVQSLLGLIVLAMLACAVLVFVSVLTHLVAQRRSSMAVLQTLGFNRRIQLLALVLEYLLVGSMGALLGIGMAYMALMLLNPHVSWVLGQIKVQEGALWQLLPALVMLGFVSLSWPALQIRTLAPVEHLRN